MLILNSLNSCALSHRRFMHFFDARESLLLHLNDVCEGDCLSTFARRALLEPSIAIAALGLLLLDAVESRHPQWLLLLCLLVVIINRLLTADI